MHISSNEIHLSILLSTSFRKLFFCMALYREVNLQNFEMIRYKTFCRSYVCTKSFFYYRHVPLLKWKVSTIFKGSLDAGFQQLPLVQNLWNLNLLWNIYNFKSMKKSKNCFLTFFLSKSFGHKINFTVNI